jgi:hypothetical protein
MSFIGRLVAIAFAMYFIFGTLTRADTCVVDCTAFQTNGWRPDPPFCTNDNPSECDRGARRSTNVWYHCKSRMLPENPPSCESNGNCVCPSTAMPQPYQLSPTGAPPF